MRAGLWLAAAVAVLVASTASAQIPTRTFECEKVWGSPSRNNSVTACLANSTHLQAWALGPKQVGYVVLFVIPVVCLIIVLLCCPFTVMGRYICKCCGSYRRRPDTVCCGGSEWDDESPEVKDTAYSVSSIRNTKAAAVIIFAIGLAPLVLAVNGTSLMNVSYTQFFSEALGVISWADGRSAAIRELMTVNSTGRLIEPLTPELFWNMGNTTADFRLQLENAKASADPYISNANIVAICIATIPLLFLVLTVLCAVLDIRTGLPCANVCCHFIFIILYSIGAVVFLIGGFFLGNVCGERDVFLANSTTPGLISYYLVPVCDHVFPFEQVKTDVTNVIGNQSLKACQNMQTICDTATTYNSAFPDVVYTCSITNPQGDCPDFVAADNIGKAMRLKSGAPVVCENNSIVETPCTLSLCGQLCNESTIRNNSAKASNNLQQAANGEVAFVVYVEPLLSCARIYTEALRPLAVCNTLASSFFFIGGGFLGYTVLFMAGLIVLWRGQKRFFKPPKTEAQLLQEAAELESDYDSDAEYEFVDPSPSPSNASPRSKATSNAASPRDQRPNEPFDQSQSMGR